MPRELDHLGLGIVGVGSQGDESLLQLGGDVGPRKDSLHQGAALASEFAAELDEDLLAGFARLALGVREAGVPGESALIVEVRVRGLGAHAGILVETTVFRMLPSGSSVAPPGAELERTRPALTGPKSSRKSLHVKTLEQESDTPPRALPAVSSRPHSIARPHLAPWLGLLALATSSSCGSGSQATPVAQGPNVLLITIDTLRADHLSAYGYPRSTSPNIDALAERGIVFERALSTSGSTLPAHLSIMTAMLPHQHGFLSNMRAMKGSFEPAEGCQTAATFFERAGWDSAAFISGNTVKRVTGIDAGFGFFGQPKTHNRTADKTCRRALSWLNERQQSGTEKPFFLWVHFWDVHEPNDPPNPIDRCSERTRRSRA